MKTFKIAGRPIGEGTPCFIIAEAGVNHNGDIKLARKLIDVAAKASADAVKFQTFHTEEVVTETAEKAEYQKECVSRRNRPLVRIEKSRLFGEIGNPVS